MSKEQTTHRAKFSLCKNGSFVLKVRATSIQKSSSLKESSPVNMVDEIKRLI